MQYMALIYHAEDAHLAQDRGRWDRLKIEEGRRLLHEALGQRRPGRYQIQAAISALHSEADDAASTDWLQIAGLYAALERHDENPIVALNRAVALSRAGQEAAALALITALGDALSSYQPFFAAHADIARRAGDLDAARASYARAAELTDSEAERAFLLTQRGACQSGER